MATSKKNLTAQHKFPVPSCDDLDLKRNFNKELKEYTDFIANRACNTGSWYEYNNQVDAMRMFLGSYGRAAESLRYNFWIEEMGADFEAIVSESLATFASTLEHEGMFVLPLSSNRFILRKHSRVVGYLMFGQITSEKFLVFVGEGDVGRSIIDFWEGVSKSRLPICINRLDVFRDAIRSQKKRIKDKKPILDEAAFFPVLDRTVYQLVQDFEESDANVLVIYGEPGLGKSQLIREMVNIKQSREGDVYIADTVDVFGHPSLVPFIHDMKVGSWFITEDSTAMVEKRESGNSLMAGILNASEGISSGNVKFIISANLTNLKDVDSALIRPGRTFAAYKFEKLSPEQANDARRAIGLEPIDFGGKKKLTLAEALNWEAHLALSSQDTRVGF